nr:uncharacterized protein LOC113815028 [Penaeus vannamei]
MLLSGDVNGLQVACMTPGQCFSITPILRTRQNITSCSKRRQDGSVQSVQEVRPQRQADHLPRAPRLRGSRVCRRSRRRRVVLDPSYLERRKVFGQLVCSFRYGREDDEVMGLNFQKDLFLASEQIYPPKDVEPTKLAGATHKEARGNALDALW